MTGGVIGQPLAMEGVFSFFLESAFLGLFLYGETPARPRGALVGGIRGLRGLVALGLLHHRDGRLDAAPGGLLSGRPTASFQVTSFWGVLVNPWALMQYAHNMCGALVTGVFVMAAVGAYYLLEGKFVEEGARVSARGVIVGVIACVAADFPYRRSARADTWPRTSR